MNLKYILTYEERYVALKLLFDSIYSDECEYDYDSCQASLRAAMAIRYRIWRENSNVQYLVVAPGKVDVIFFL